MTDNTAILKRANERIAAGDIEGFLEFCDDDIRWTTVGETPLVGKRAVREWMADAYVQPPKFAVSEMVADDATVVAIGEISLQDGDQERTAHYCDVWRFRDGKMIDLRAFVVG